MTYLVIFNGYKYAEEKIKAESWLKFISELNRLVKIYNQPPDIIYLVSMK
jgi:hypothetical protein